MHETATSTKHVMLHSYQTLPSDVTFIPVMFHCHICMYLVTRLWNQHIKYEAWSL